MTNKKPRMVVSRPFIVARLTNTGLKPSKSPHLHRTSEEAVMEADRLSSVHKEQFCVLGTISVTPRKFNELSQGQKHRITKRASWSPISMSDVLDSNIL